MSLIESSRGIGVFLAFDNPIWFRQNQREAGQKNCFDNCSKNKAS